MPADGTAGPPANDYGAQIFAAFAREVFNPLVSMTGVAPADCRKLLGDIRDRLDVIERVIETAEAASYPNGPIRAPIAPEASAGDAGADGSSLNDIGRNQRSRVRELVILEALAHEAKAYSLQQVLSALAQRGFKEDTPSAVVSQLHRLKKLDLIRQPPGATGMYEITNDGLGHARSLRASFGPYLPL